MPKSEQTEGIFNGEKIIIVKPQTYMNLSGDAVAEIAAYYKIAPQDILVIADDISMEF